MSRCSEGQMPGSGETRPNPVFCAMPTHPENTSAAAGAARTTQARVRGWGGVDADCSHAGHHPSVVASGWGSAVSAVSAAATSARLART